MHGRISPIAEGVLRRMRMVADLATAPFDGSDEWLRITARGVPDYALFQKLRFRWPMVAGIHMDKVALIHCKTDPHSGLWLHDLASLGTGAIYQAGCHEVATWNQQSAFVTSSNAQGLRAAVK